MPPFKGSIDFYEGFKEKFKWKTRERAGGDPIRTSHPTKKDEGGTPSSFFTA